MDEQEQEHNPYKPEWLYTIEERIEHFIFTIRFWLWNSFISIPPVARVRSLWVPMHPTIKLAIKMEFPLLVAASGITLIAVKFPQNYTSGVFYWWMAVVLVLCMGFEANLQDWRKSFHWDNPLGNRQFLTVWFMEHLLSAWAIIAMSLILSNAFMWLVTEPHAGSPATIAQFHTVIVIALSVIGLVVIALQGWNLFHPDLEDLI